MSPSNRYPIRAAARLTGLSIETLRAWERRYAVVEPRREGGVRTYGDDDVRKLRLLHGLVEAGFGIGRLAGRSERELRALADAGGRAQGRDVLPRPGDAAVGAVWSALERFDVDAAEAALERLAAVMPAETLCLEVAIPLLRKVGEGWSAGHLGIAQEHLLSGALRTLLGSLARLLRPPPASGSRRVVLAGPEGEHHELGLSAASLLAAAARLSPVFLGANVPVRDVLDAVRWTRPIAVVIAAVSERTAPDPATAVSAIARGVPRGVAVLVGGAKAERLAAALQAGPARWVPSLEALSAELQRIGVA